MKITHTIALISALTLLAPAVTYARDDIRVALPGVSVNLPLPPLPQIVIRGDDRYEPDWRYVPPPRHYGYYHEHYYHRHHDHGRRHYGHHRGHRYGHYKDRDEWHEERRHGRH